MRGNQHKLGAGKLEEIAVLVQNEAADVVVFDQALTPSYNQMLSDRLGVKVIDKTVLILDIFAQRARAARANIKWSWRSSIISCRGSLAWVRRCRVSAVASGPVVPARPSSKPIGRHIRRRIHHITRELENVKSNRELQRNARMKQQAFQSRSSAIPTPARARCSTASPTTTFTPPTSFLRPSTQRRGRLELEGGEVLLVSDTVGFIRDLPSQLLDAFKATLEELQYADVLLHVVDVAKEGIDERIRVVEDILMSLGLSEKTHILVCNKIDLCEEPPVFSSGLAYQQKCFISCETGQGLAELVDLLKKIAQASDVVLEMTLPYDSAQGQRIAQAHQFGRVLAEEYDETGAKLKVQMPLPEAKKIFSGVSPPRNRKRNEVVEEYDHYFLID